MAEKAGYRHPSRPFTKGDPRINRKGRPRTFNGLRELARTIAQEVMQDAETGKAEVYDVSHRERALTVAEKILRDWALSNNPLLQRAFMEYTFGKVPDQSTVNNSGEMTIRIVDEAETPGAAKTADEIEPDFETGDEATEEDDDD